MAYNGFNRPHAIHPNETVGAAPVCPPERSRSDVSIPTNTRIVRGVLNDGCALVGRHGRAHRHRPYPSPSYFSTQSYTNKRTIYMQFAQRKPTTYAQSSKRHQPSMRNLPKRNCRGDACVPARTSAQRRFHTKNTRIVCGDERRMRPCRATRAGTQAPPLPISIIFFHAIPHKQNHPFHA